MTNLTTKARKLAGILVVPAWRAALHRLRLAGVYHMSYDDRGRAVQADFLFGRNGV